MLNRLKRLPFELRVALAATIGVCLLNILWALNQASWKIDPGLATLVGAVVGFWIVAYQTRRGFANLTRSQANQAELDREARLHQAELERAAKEAERQAQKAQLLAAIRAELVAVLDRVQGIQRAHEFQFRVSNAAAKAGVPYQSKGMTLAFPDAPIFRANIDKLGLLGPYLGADVIKVLSRADGKQHKIPFDTPMPADAVAILEKGLVKTQKKWAADIYHVAMRIRAFEEGTPDPGSLIETESARYAEIDDADEKGA